MAVRKTVKSRKGSGVVKDRTESGVVEEGREPAGAAPSGGAGAPAAGASGERHQYLTFVIGAEEYGIDILRVQEIKGYTTITSIPNAPPWIKGVMNLRGTVVPVVDLRVKFGIQDPQYDSFTVVIMVMVGERVVGLVVDSVSDVLDVAEVDRVATPDMGSGIDTSFMTGIAKQGDRLISLLEIERVVGFDSGFEQSLAA